MDLGATVEIQIIGFTYSTIFFALFDFCAHYFLRPLRLSLKHFCVLFQCCGHVPIQTSLTLVIAVQYSNTSPNREPHLCELEPGAQELGFTVSALKFLLFASSTDLHWSFFTIDFYLILINFAF